MADSRLRNHPIRYEQRKGEPVSIRHDGHSIEETVPPNRNSQGMSIPRRQFLPLLAAAGAASLPACLAVADPLSSLSDVSTTSSVPHGASGNPTAFEGYSILSPDHGGYALARGQEVVRGVRPFDGGLGRSGPEGAGVTERVSTGARGQLRRGGGLGVRRFGQRVRDFRAVFGVSTIHSRKQPWARAGDK